MSKPDVVTVRGLRKSYRTRVVVDGLDLDVPAGEIVGLIGANGAGKTTTVECVQGLRKPDGGTLRVLGLDPVTQADQLRLQVVILDELTQGLDPAARRTVWSAVRQLNDEGTTVLLVTHEMDEAEALCGQVVVMRAGRVIDAGAPRTWWNATRARRRSGSACRTRPRSCWTSSAGSTGCGRWNGLGRRSRYAVTAASSATSAPPWCAGSRCLPT
ncbi:MAG TPA: ATP-binding cassette domain-containing protein [Streptosporangiaceae bacterium]|jgi:ABC-type multidrug transport system ATPase subunit|nr:ATP-binding cassette domain-containing protein [Streptosporangiaceae bacterium]